jgi:hypothetical protein
MNSDQFRSLQRALDMPEVKDKERARRLLEQSIRETDTEDK